MRRNDLRWVQVRVTGQAARSAREFSLGVMSTAMLDSGFVDIELPDLSEYATPLAKARILLDSAAEIEHALMVQYLYAAYSLRDDEELTADQRKAIEQWRSWIVQTAVEEMGHLMTVQNLLLFLRQPPNFEREDFPTRKHLYPFPMQLEPLSQKSLARYVVAESPYGAKGIDDIVNLGTGSDKIVINRVGILYAILGVVFTKSEELESNVHEGDPWTTSIRDIGRSLFARFPDLQPEEWHLEDADFEPYSTGQQAGSDWERGRTKVPVVANRKDCLEALKLISIRGEGISNKQDEESHFERFLKIYRGSWSEGQDSLIAFPPEGDWVPTRQVPTDPVIVHVEPEVPPAVELVEYPNAISEPMAASWADLANLRYALLLGWLQQYFHSDFSGAHRTAIKNWCFSAMRALTLLNDGLVTFNRRKDALVKSALPFNLPEVINLPTDQWSRIALLHRRVARSWAIIEVLNEPKLSPLKVADEKLFEALGIDPPRPTKPEAYEPSPQLVVL